MVDQGNPKVSEIFPEIFCPEKPSQKNISIPEMRCGRCHRVARESLG